MSKQPLAVLISDVHFTVQTLPLADFAFRMAIDKAAELGVPLIDCGDLTNDKAVLRAEVVNALVETMRYAEAKCVPVKLLVGNHSLLNEKGSDHALRFLEPYAEVISAPVAIGRLGFIPYQSTSSAFYAAFDKFTPGSILIVHQGMKSGKMGHYLQDSSAVDPAVLRGFRTIGGHYHNRHYVLNHSFVGNPYTLTYGEANDPEKGFQVLYDDGSLEFVPTKLRKHVVVEYTWGGPVPKADIRLGDLVWIKVIGPASEITIVPKHKWGQMVGVQDTNFKLDLIVIKNDKLAPRAENITDDVLLDSLIDTSSETDEEKQSLKSLWRAIYEA